MALLDLSKKTALIVDNNEASADGMKTALKQAGILQADTAKEVPEAIQRIRAKTGNLAYDIVASEYYLGEGRSGQQFLEELRHRSLLPLRTAFMIVTSEASYEKVVLAAEVAPESYLLKPFTAGKFSDRVVKALVKRDELLPIYSAIEARRYEEAVGHCRAFLVDPEKAEYRWDIMRLLAETHYDMRNHAHSHAIYSRIFEETRFPWARLGMARNETAMGHYGEAEAGLKSVIASAPQYLKAYDHLAEVQALDGRISEARSTMGVAVKFSPSKIDRLKRSGDMAVLDGDLVGARQIYETVLSKGKGSYFYSAADHERLAMVHAELGDHDKAMKTIASMRKEFKDAEFLANLAETEAKIRFAAKLPVDTPKDDLDAAHAAAKELFEKTFALYEEKGETIEMTLDAQIRFAYHCILYGHADVAETLFFELAENANSSKGILSQVQQLVLDANVCSDLMAMFLRFRRMRLFRLLDQADESRDNGVPQYPAFQKRLAEIFKVHAGDPEFTDEIRERFGRHCAEEIKIWSDKGKELARAQNWKDAITYFRSAVGGLPRNVEILIAAAQNLIIYLKNSEVVPDALLEESRNYVSRAEMLVPKDPMVSLTRRMLNDLEKKLEMERAAMKTSVVETPSSAPVQNAPTNREEQDLDDVLAACALG